MDNEYAKGTTEGKIKLVLYLFVLLILYLLIKVVLHTYFPMPAEPNAHSIRDIQKLSIFNIYLNAFALCLFIYGAYFSYRFGTKIKESRQYPPLNAKMPFTMKVVRGKKALVQAYGSYAMSILLLSYGLFNLVFSIYYSNIMNGVADGF